MEILAEQWKRDNYLTDKYKEVKEKLKNYIKSNELVEAGKLIEQYHKILFLDIEYIYWLGMYYHRMGKNEKAIEILLAANKQVPYNIQIHYALWKLNKEEKKYIEASKHYLEAYLIALQENEKIVEEEKFSLGVLKNLVYEEIRDESLQEIVKKELSQLIISFNNRLKIANPKVFPTLDVDETKTCLGKFYQYLDKKYYVGYYGNYMQVEQVEQSRLINKCEIFRADLKKYFKGGIEGETTLVPIATLEKDTQLFIQEDNK